MPESKMALGFIGLGVMGSRMATRLVDAGHPVTAFDLRRDAVEALAARGARAGTSCKDVADRADIVLCSLGLPRDVETVMTGESGVIHGGRAKIAIDLSTTGSSTERRIAAALAPRGIVLIDAPVSGGSHGAEAGSLAVMASGPRAAFDRAKPALDVIGNVIYLGPESGHGQTMKLINNMISATCTFATFEAMVFGAKMGLDPERMLAVLNAGAGRNIATTHKIPACVLPRTFPRLFTTDLMFKDVKLGVEEAEAAGAHLWVIDATRALLAFAVAQGDGPEDWATIIKHFERWANVTVGKAEAP